MDTQGFRLKGEPDLTVQPSWYKVRKETQREIDATKTVNAPDSRYSAYAAPLEDGRLVTDYRQSCVTRAPPGQQFATKNWTVHNADDIISISRARQAQTTGHVLGTANTDVPPSIIQKCNPSGCEFYGSGMLMGLGIERQEDVPQLFGTFTVNPAAGTLAGNVKHIDLNNTIEYGRNTPSRWVNLYQ